LERPPAARPAEPDRRTATGVVRDLLRLPRPGQWAKNVVVCVPLLDLAVWRPAAAWRVAWAVLAFILAAGLVYIANDLVDRHRDSRHPTKRLRPIAAGRVSPRTAAAVAVAVAALLAGVLSLQPWDRGWPVLAYLVLCLGYIGWLKHLPLLDVFAVAAGFGLRVVLGYLALGIPISGWLLTCVFCLCLLLSVGKRRQELAVTGGAHRPALRGYTVHLADQLMLLSAMLTVGSYLLYLRTEAPLGTLGPAAAVLSAPMALFGMFRYLQLVLVHGGGENPVRTLFRDPALVVNAALWLVVSAGFLLAPHAGAFT
jgi:4-hydroxybenzoate polyprenyltransferase